MSTSATRTAPARRLARLAAGVLVGVTALTASACAPQQAGAAALVGDRRVPQGDLDAALKGIREGNPQFAQVPAGAVLVDLIAEPYLLAAAAKAGQPVSQDQARQLLPSTDHPDERAVRVLQAQIALESLDAQALAGVSKQLDQAKVKVSPRYGTFDSAKFSLSQPTPDWVQKSDAVSGIPTLPGGQPQQGDQGVAPGEPAPDGSTPTTPAG